MQTISVILGVVLLGIGANDATAKEDWVCGPSELIRHIALYPTDQKSEPVNGYQKRSYSDIYKWIGMCYSRPEGECEEGWGDGKCKRVDAYDTVAPLSNNACSCTSEDNKDTICVHWNSVHRVDKCAPQPEERVSADGTIDEEECPFIYTAADCEIEALAKGLRIGGEGYDFEGDYGTKGCYAYDSGAYEGIAFFGTDGDAADMEAEAQTAKGKYRVTGPCSEIIEEAIDIVEKAIEDCKEFYAADPRRIRTRYDSKYIGVKERKVALKKHLNACGDSRAYQYFLDGATPDCFISTYRWDSVWRSDNVHPTDYSKPYIYCDGIKTLLVNALWKASDESRAKKVKSCEEYNKVWRARGGSELTRIRDCNKANISLATGRDYDTKGITCGTSDGTDRHDEGPTGCLSDKEDSEVYPEHEGDTYGTIEDWSELPWGRVPQH
jgi:hypothetical protein